MSMCSYELMREENIAKNNAMLRALGLLNDPLPPPELKTAVPRSQRPKKVVQPSRKSKRLNDIPYVYQEVLSSSDDEDDDRMTKRKGKKKVARVSASITGSNVPCRKSQRRSQRRSLQAGPGLYTEIDVKSDDDSDGEDYFVHDGEQVSENGSHSASTSFADTLPNYSSLIFTYPIYILDDGS